MMDGDGDERGVEVDEYGGESERRVRGRGERKRWMNMMVRG